MRGNSARAFVPLLVDALERRTAVRRSKSRMRFSAGDGALIRAQCGRSGRYMASKLITASREPLTPGGLRRFKPSASFRRENGRPLRCSTAPNSPIGDRGRSALGARVLARLSPRVHLVVGARRDVDQAGACASGGTPIAGEGFHLETETHARAVETLPPARPSRSTPGGRGSRCSRRCGDIITTCTRYGEPLIKGALLRAGTHLDLVGGYNRKPVSGRRRGTARDRFYRPSPSRPSTASAIFGPIASRRDPRKRTCTAICNDSDRRYSFGPPVGHRHHVLQKRGVAGISIWMTRKRYSAALARRTSTPSCPHLLRASTSSFVKAQQERRGWPEQVRP